MRTGDKVKFKNYREDIGNLPTTYLYGDSDLLSKRLGISIAKQLKAPNKGTIIEDFQTDTHILVQYTDVAGHTGVLFFNKGCLELTDEVVNDYQIY